MTKRSNSSQRRHPVVLAVLLVVAMLALAPTAGANSRNEARTASDFGAVTLAAVPGDYDAKALIADTTEDYIDVAIMLKLAHSGSPELRVAEQNYRLIYDPDVFGFGTNTSQYIIPRPGHLNGSVGSSLYSSPTLTGSEVNQGVGYISYNVELIAGDGYDLTTSWHETARVRLFFDDPSLDEHLVNIRLQNDSADFPPTYVGGYDKPTDQLYIADGRYFYGIYETVPTPGLCCVIATVDW